VQFHRPTHPLFSDKLSIRYAWWSREMRGGAGGAAGRLRNATTRSAELQERGFVSCGD